MTFVLNDVFELLMNLLQGVIFAVFIYNYLTPKFTKQLNILCCIGNVTLMFISVSVINYLNVSYSWVEVPSFLLVMMCYSVFCFKDKLILKLIAPIIEYVLISCLSILYQALFSTLLRKNNAYISYGGNLVYRMIVCMLVNITLILMLWLVYKFHKKNLNFKDSKDILMFIIFPVIIIAVILLLSLVYFDANLNNVNRLYIAIATVLMIGITFLVLVIFERISKLNEVYVQNLIMKNKEKMYKNEMENSNRYIKEVSKIKHDINNEILCIRELLYKNSIDEAISVCDAVVDKLGKVSGAMNTSNLYLNSIMNVIFKKASDNEIKIKTQISNELNHIDGNDIIVIFGNICDNAIEYLSDKSNRRLDISISKKGNMDIINISNSIETSVLKSNPNLRSSKNDKMHGYGIINVKKVLAKYNGEINFYEDDDTFNVLIMLMQQNIT